MLALQKSILVCAKMLAILCLSLLALFSLLGVLKLVFATLPMLELQPQTLSFLMMCLHTASFIAAAIMMYYALEGKKWSMGWLQVGFARELHRGMLLGIILISASFLLIWLCGGLHFIQLQFSRQLWLPLLQALILFLLVAVSEEVFSRGYVQGLVKYHFGRSWAIAISSILFALLHSLNPGVFEHTLPMVNLLLAGLLLGISREVSGGLWLPIGLHFTWNFFQGNVYGFAVSGMETASLVEQEPLGNTLISGGAFGAEGSIITSIVLVLGCYYLLRRSAAPTSF